MPYFLDKIFAQLHRSAGRVVLRETRGEQLVSVTGQELLDRIQRVRAYVRHLGLGAGDRCAVIGPNSIGWVAIDLALMAEGVIVVPLYSRQAPAEVAAMIKDCQPRLLLAGDTDFEKALAGGLLSASFDEVLQGVPDAREVEARPVERTEDALVKIIYTSGTSGEPKGVCLNTGNVSFMLSRTTERLDQIMRGSHGADSVFHYLPLNFAASWIATLSFLSRESVVTLSTDLNRLADEIRLTGPHYFLNVPTLLERVRRGVEDAIAKRPAPIRSLFAKARGASQRQQIQSAKGFDVF